LERNSTLKTYWQNAATHEGNNLLNFDENNADLIWKQSLKQHGYKLLDKIDQLIMIMVTHVATIDSNDSVLKDYFLRIAETHVQYKIKQDHIDVRKTYEKKSIHLLFNRLFPKVFLNVLKLWWRRMEVNGQ
jgi:hemoglobin-like flavoprotein